LWSQSLSASTSGKGVGPMGSVQVSVMRRPTDIWRSFMVAVLVLSSFTLNSTFFRDNVTARFDVLNLVNNQIGAYNVSAVDPFNAFVLFLCFSFGLNMVQ